MRLPDSEIIPQCRLSFRDCEGYLRHGSTRLLSKGGAPSPHFVGSVVSGPHALILRVIVSLPVLRLEALASWNHVSCQCLLAAGFLPLWHQSVRIRRFAALH